MSQKSFERILRSLKLTTAANELKEVLSETNSNVSFGWATNLLQRELDWRREKALQNKIKRARFPEIKSIEAFDWEFNKKISKKKLDDIITLDFIKERDIILFLGQPGTGKSHLASAIGLKSIYHGHTVYWSSLKMLAEDIRKAKDRNDLPRLFKKILTSQLWILDDWGVVSLARDISEEVFDLLDRRKNNTAMILTSNRDINEWPEVFVDPVLASAAIDRIFDRANITIFNGKSYRAEGKKDKKVEKLSEVSL